MVLIKFSDPWEQRIGVQVVITKKFKEDFTKEGTLELGLRVYQVEKD